MESEVTIIEKAAEGDAKSWDILYTKYNKALLGFIKSHNRHINEMDAE